ncbi:MAG: winged helix-turn-helix transcriptional regulator [Candidatus Heimdallarchaeota archaeon]|nr:winged helix-turn-helix transcriptional regulator [Candidatus Heimdallarchaeota archaeon]
MRTKTYFPILTVLALLGIMMFNPNITMIQGQTESASNISINSTHQIIIRSHIASVDIFTVNSVSMSESFVIENLNALPISSIDLWFNHSISTLVIEDAEGSLIYNWYPITNTSNLVEVSFRYDVEQNETSSFVVKYDIITPLVLTESDPSFYYFEFYSSISHFTLSHTFSIILPERSFIHETDGGLSPFYPLNATQILIKNRIIVSWMFTNLSSSSNPFFLVRFDEPIILEPESSFLTSSYSLFIFGVIAGIFLGVASTTWLIRYREKKAIQKLGRVLLNENQKALIKIIYDKKGKISQRDLCEITGYSKSKISRNLVPLEERGLIKRERWGRTYVVFLTDDGRTVIE